MRRLCLLISLEGGAQDTFTDKAGRARRDVKTRRDAKRAGARGCGVQHEYRLRVVRVLLVARVAVGLISLF